MARAGFMIYGAYGYTGQLIARRALAHGHRPLLAGRDAAKLAALADELGLPHVVAPLDDRGALERALSGVQIVCHAAGPFVHTAQVMQQACLASGTSYVDITGEIPVFEALFALDAAAQAARIAMISGLGFDVVPSDCLASYVAAGLDEPSELQIAFATTGRPSAGTVRASLEGVLRGNFVRRAGELTRVSFGHAMREVPFRGGTRMGLPIPWGDLSTAFRTTGIPNITTYIAVPRAAARLLGASPPLLHRLGRALERGFERPFMRAALMAAVDACVADPSPRDREQGGAQLWARAVNARGDSREAWLDTPDGYAFTAEAVVLGLERLLHSPVFGALTPALAFGADFVLAVSGTRRYESPRSS